MKTQQRQYLLQAYSQVWTADESRHKTIDPTALEISEKQWQDSVFSIQSIGGCTRNRAINREPDQLARAYLSIQTLRHLPQHPPPHLFLSLHPRLDETVRLSSPIARRYPRNLPRVSLLPDPRKTGKACVARSLPHGHRDQMVALLQKAFEPPAKERLVGEGAPELSLGVLHFALLGIAHLQHLLRQLAVLVGLVFRFVIREFLLLLDPEIRFSTMSQGLLVEKSFVSGLTDSGGGLLRSKASGPSPVDPVALG